MKIIFQLNLGANVFVNKDVSNRMASTIRHNRARGSHSIELMTSIVSELVEAGMGDAWILRHIGMDKDELLRLKQVTGIAELFKDKTFSTFEKVQSAFLELLIEEAIETEKTLNKVLTEMQIDGNLVIYDRNGKPTWASNTGGKGKGPFRIVMQDDYNLVIYGSTGPTWASRSA